MHTYVLTYLHCFYHSSDISCQGPPDFEVVEKRTQVEIDKGAFTYDVRYFSGIFDLPTYPHQILYYISLFSKIR